MHTVLLLLILSALFSAVQLSSGPCKERSRVWALGLLIAGVLFGAPFYAR